MAEQEEKTIDLGDDEVTTDVEVGGDSELKVNSEPEVSVSEVSVSEVSVSEEQEEYQTSVQRRIDKLTKRMRESERREQAAVEYAQNVQKAPAAASQPAAETDPKAEAWASRNEWFGKDEAMTFAAFGLHKRLVENEEFDPTSDEYYSELDKRMRNEFPQKLNGGTRKPSQTVASVSRSGSPGRSRKVRLTPSQVAIAKKLGVPLEEYAKYVKE